MLSPAEPSALGGLGHSYREDGLSVGYKKLTASRDGMKSRAGLRNNLTEPFTGQSVEESPSGVVYPLQSWPKLRAASAKYRGVRYLEFCGPLRCVRSYVLPQG